MSQKVYVKGDTQGSSDIWKLWANSWPEGQKLTKDDFVIIAGDFGLVYYPENRNKTILDTLNEQPWTTLFIDGNHENFDRLYSYQETTRFGGPVGVVRPSVLHLKARGHVYDIGGKRIWCFGGGVSCDKNQRVEGESWWPQELPTEEEMDYGLEQIAKYGGQFDYILTHDCPSRVLIPCWPYFCSHNSSSKRTPTIVGEYLDKVAGMVSFKKWVFGHYHTDIKCEFPDTHQMYRAVFRDIVRLK